MTTNYQASLYLKAQRLAFLRRKQAERMAQVARYVAQVKAERDKGLTSAKRCG